MDATIYALCWHKNFEFALRKTYFPRCKPYKQRKQATHAVVAILISSLRFLSASRFVLENGPGVVICLDRRGRGSGGDGGRPARLDTPASVGSLPSYRCKVRRGYLLNCLIGDCLSVVYCRGIWNGIVRMDLFMVRASKGLPLALFQKTLHLQ